MARTKCTKIVLYTGNIPCKEHQMRCTGVSLISTVYCTEHWVMSRGIA